MKRCSLLILGMFVLLFAGSAFSQLAVRAPMRLDVDYARFRGNDTLVFVEFYYGVPERVLTYTATENGFRGAINVDLIMRDGDQILFADRWRVPHVVNDTATHTLTRNLTGVTNVALRQGNYNCEMRLFDETATDHSDTIRFPLKVVGFETDRDQLSDIEFCTSIRQIPPDSLNIFFKNTLEVIPNPSGLFGDGVPTLFYYVEAYNLLSTQSDVYRTRVLIIDGIGKEVFRQEREKKRQYESSVEIGTVDLRKFHGGAYLMKFELTDSVKGTLASATKKFFVYRAATAQFETGQSTQVDLLSSEFAVMNEPELDFDFARAVYCARAKEIAKYTELGSLKSEEERVNAKRAFLFRFWRDQDQRNFMQPNEFRKEYIKRVEYATRSFSAGHREGWRNDRGRVYIIYGPPDDIDRFPSSSDRNPYEIWSYHSLQGGVTFFFVDRSAFGDWTLVHSTHRGEIQDENWMRQVQR